MAKRRNEYERYLHSQAWRAKRAAAFRHHGRCCSRCPATARLHVHHKTYARFGGGELMEDLQILCETCHRVVHKTVPITKVTRKQKRKDNRGWRKPQTAPTKRARILTAENDQLHQQQIRAKERRKRRAAWSSNR